jgi:hypothetical protein
MSGVRFDPVARFWRLVEKTDSCWLWVGAKRKGYGKFIVRSSKKPRMDLEVFAHRFSYELKFGMVPQGMDLDHLCRVHNCVNPDHLEVVTRRTNILRGVSPAAINHKKTHCIHGHEFSGNNLWMRKDGTRQCRTCKRESQKRNWPKRLEARRATRVRRTRSL